jgi:hypothetical protein
MQVWERQKEQVPKKHAIEKCNSERNKTEKWRKCKKKNANHTRDQLDKHDFGKVAKS